MLSKWSEPSKLDNLMSTKCALLRYLHREGYILSKLEHMIMGDVDSRHSDSVSLYKTYESRKMHFLDEMSQMNITDPEKTKEGHSKVIVGPNEGAYSKIVNNRVVKIFVVYAIETKTPKKKTSINKMSASTITNACRVITSKADEYDSYLLIYNAVPSDFEQINIINKNQKLVHYLDTDLVILTQRHALTPVHSLVSEEDKMKILTSTRASSTMFPVIGSLDTMAVEGEYKSGDMVRIGRHTDGLITHLDSYIYIRMVKQQVVKGNAESY